jgi:hypothetical protein
VEDVVQQSPHFCSPCYELRGLFRITDCGTSLFRLGEATEKTEGGIDFIFLPRLVLPEGCAPREMQSAFLWRPLTTLCILLQMSRMQ